MNDEFKQPVNRNIYLQSPSEWVETGYPNFLGVFARNLGVNFGGEKK